MAAAATLLTGCSDDPGLQERLNRLQAEMQEKDRQLQDAQSTLEKTKSELKSARAASTNKPAGADSSATSPTPAPQFLSREQVEESYGAASKAMQKRVASELRNFSVENCTQFPVVMPSDEFPYHSKVALSIRSDSGHAYQLEFPVSADVTGKWTFPSSVDIAGALANSRAQDQNTSVAANTSTPTPAATSTPRVAQTTGTPRSAPGSSEQVVPGMPSTVTKTITWGDPKSPSTVRSSPTPVSFPGNNNMTPTPTPVAPRIVQQPTPQASSSKPPTQAMPSDKDVTIHW